MQLRPLAFVVMSYSLCASVILLFDQLLGTVTQASAPDSKVQDCHWLERRLADEAAEEPNEGEAGSRLPEGEDSYTQCLTPGE